MSYGCPLSVRPKELVKDTDWRSSGGLSAEALVSCTAGSVSVNTNVLGGCSSTHSGRELLRERRQDGKDDVNRSSLTFNVHVVEVRKNVKLPYHRLNHWEPHLHLSLSILGTLLVILILQATTKTIPGTDAAMRYILGKHQLCRQSVE